MKNKFPPKIIPTKSAIEWANSAGYPVEPFEIPDNGHDNSKFLSQYALENSKHLPRNISSMLEFESRAEFDRPHIIYAKDIYVLVWNWGSTQATYNYKYFLLSESGHLFCEPPSHDVSWLKHFPIFQRLDDLTYTIDNRYFSQIEEFGLNSPHLFACSSSQFGHWIADTLPLLSLATVDESLKCKPVLSTNLNKYQYETVKTIISLPSHNKGIDVTFVDLGNSPFKIIKFPYLDILATFSVKKKNSVLRKIVGEVQSTNSHMYTERKSSGIYLYRGIQNGTRRVLNEEAFVATLKSKGIDIISTDSLSFRDTACIFSSYGLFIVPFGSGNTHFNISSKADAEMILLVPSSIQRGDYAFAYGAGIYLTPSIDRTRLIYCHQADPDNTSMHAEFSITKGLESEILDYFFAPMSGGSL